MVNYQIMKLVLCYKLRKIYLVIYLYLDFTNSNNIYI